MNVFILYTFILLFFINQVSAGTIIYTTNFPGQFPFDLIINQDYANETYVDLPLTTVPPTPQKKQVDSVNYIYNISVSRRGGEYYYPCLESLGGRRLEYIDFPKDKILTLYIGFDNVSNDLTCVGN